MIWRECTSALEMVLFQTIHILGPTNQSRIIYFVFYCTNFFMGRIEIWSSYGFFSWIGFMLWIYRSLLHGWLSMCRHINWCLSWFRNSTKWMPGRKSQIKQWTCLVYAFWNCRSIIREMVSLTSKMASRTITLLVLGIDIGNGKFMKY